MASTDTTAAPAASTIGRDLLASVVVFLVALPLCMGISIASGMPATAGIITGIVGGIIVGCLAGSPLQVSGPAAGLSVLVLQLVQQHGVEMIGTIVLFAGILQFIAGQLKLGQWFRAVSPAVIHGMLAGIGVLILVSQFHVMFDGRPIGTGIANLLGIPETVARAFNPIASADPKDPRVAVNLAAGLLGLATIAVIFAWSSLVPKSLKVIPAPLVGVAAAMLAAPLFHLDAIKYVQVPENFLRDAFSNLPTFEKLSRITDLPILVGAISIAFIASAETLLCATAVDQMHSGPRTKYDKELWAQGVGNTICGLLGVLPMTGVIVRSGANVEAGAQTRASAILHGVWLLLFAAFMPWMLRYVPLSALAGVLVFTGYKLAYPKILPVLLKYGWLEVAIYFITIITIVLTNLLDGVLVGLGLSLLKILYAFSQIKDRKGVSKLSIRKEETAESNRVDLHLDGSATLIRLPQLAAVLEGLQPGADVHVHIVSLDYIDHACLDLLTNWDKQHKGTGGKLTIEWDNLAQKYHDRHGTGAAPVVVA